MSNLYRKKIYDKNRKERKATWRRVTGLVKQYPECVIADGLAYCNHVWEPNRPWVWVDFRFFHTKQKRYFAVAMRTAEYEAEGIAGDKAWDVSFEKFPSKPDLEKALSWKDGETFTQRNEYIDARHTCYNESVAALVKETYTVHPRIQVKDYGKVAVGLWVTVNKPFIDENVIKEFIEFYRELGERTKPGLAWKGEAVEVIPEEITKRYAY